MNDDVLLAVVGDQTMTMGDKRVRSSYTAIIQGGPATKYGEARRGGKMIRVFE